MANVCIRPRHVVLVQKGSRGAVADNSLPVPLVPADVDLQDFRYMPIDITRLFSSEFHARSNDAEFRAGFTLWAKSFHQIPAASIPDDDVVLAQLAELGRNVDGWIAIKSGALRGWIKCSDGRWYHPVVATKALSAWIDKLGKRRGGSVGNAIRWGGPGPAGLKLIDRQIAATAKALKRLQGEIKADDGISVALGKAEKLLSKKKGHNNVLDASLSDRTPITERSQDRVKVIDKEEERGAIADPPSDAPVGAISRPRKARQARQNTLWPVGFELTPEMATYARTAGHDGAKLFEKFRNKAQAKGWEYRDWAAAFRNFVVSERSFAPQQAYGTRQDGTWKPPPC